MVEGRKKARKKEEGTTMQLATWTRRRIRPQLYCSQLTTNSISGSNRGAESLVESRRKNQKRRNTGQTRNKIDAGWLTSIFRSPQTERRCHKCVFTQYAKRNDTDMHSSHTEWKKEEMIGMSMLHNS